MYAYKNNIKKLYFFKLFSSMYFFSGILIPFFIDWGKITYLQIMLLQTWFVLWVAILEIPTGAVADFLGRKTSIIIGAIVNIAAVISYTIYPNFYIFLLAEFLWALSTALISGADVALVYDSLKETGKEKESKKVLGKYNSAGLLGIIIAAPIGSLVAQKFGLQYAVMMMSVTFIVSAIIAMTLKEPKYKKEKESLRYLSTLTEGIKYFYNSKILRILAFDSISISVLSFFIVWIYQPLLIDFGVPLFIFGIVHAAGTFSEILVSNNFSNLEKFVGSKKRFAFLSALLIAFSFILVSIVTTIYLVIPLILIIFAFGFTRGVLFNHYMNKYIESNKRATVLSTISMINTLGRAIFSPLIGLLITYSINLTFLILGILIAGLSIFSRVEEKMLID